MNLLHPRLREMQHIGPAGCMQLAEYIHETGKQFQNLRDQVQAQEDAALLELSKKPGFEWVASHIRKA